MATNTTELMNEFRTRATVQRLNVQVGGNGSFYSDLAIVAESPGVNELRMGVPLVGTSGRYLWEELRQIGINRSDCYVTNTVKRQLLVDGSDDKQLVHKSELAQWQALLRWELSQLPNLKYVLVLGGYALEALCGEQKISEWRGSVLKRGLLDRDITYVCTVNPAMVLREPKFELIFKFDVRKLRRVMDNEWQPFVIESHINPTYHDALDYIRKLECENQEVSFDIEVINKETACVGISNENHFGMCINFRDHEGNRYSVAEELHIRQRLQDLLGSPKTRLIAQNGNFDSYWLWYKDRIKVHAVYFDTMLAHHLMYPQLPHNLGFLTSQYTTHPYYKNEKSEWRNKGDINAFWEYNVKDVCITRAVYQRLLHELREQKMDQQFFNHIMRLQRHLVWMTVTGIKCDQSLKQSIASELNDKVAQLKQTFIDAVHVATNDPTFSPSPNSPKQLQQLFFSRLKLVGRGVTTDADNRARMYNHPRTPPAAKEIFTILNEYQKERKFLSTYAEMTVDEDERIRCEYKQTGTQSAPGRLSSASVLWGSGTNLQNQPERAHPMFVADEGYEFNYFDLSQAEARVVAALSDCKALLENFERATEDSSFDVHRGNAARIFKVPYEDVPTYDRNPDGSVTLRFLGKRCVHGLNYRMGAQKLADVCGISLSQAHQAHRAYFEAFPEILAWQEDTILVLKRTRTLYTSFGRRLILLERVTDESLESAIAFVPQSTIGDKVCSVIYECHEDPEWPSDARMILNIHDALISINKIGLGSEVRRIMKRHATAPMFINGHEVSIPCEFKVSKPDELGIHRWSTLSKLKEAV
jgi:uracil-DNA glycosylase family 4